MSPRKSTLFVFGGLLAFSLLAVTGCQSAPKDQPQALTSRVEKQEKKHTHGVVGKSNYLRHAHR